MCNTKNRLTRVETNIQLKDKICRNATSYHQLQQDKNDVLIDVINKVCIDIKTHETHIMLKLGDVSKTKHYTFPRLSFMSP